MLARTLAAVAALATVTRAQSLLPADHVALDSLAAFQPAAANWRLSGALAGEPRRDPALTATEGTGVLVCNPTPQARAHLFTTWEHGDLDLDLDFLLTPGSNSGIYLQGRYEVQLFDSWGVKEPKATDCGGISGRAAPRANACRAPGLWQHLHIEFQAPRFDTSGQKTANARFVKVVLNGYTLHENVEVAGPTETAAFQDEQPQGALMLQGDHGPVALRHFVYKRYDGTTGLVLEKLGYALHPGVFSQISDYPGKAPVVTGTPTRFSPAAVENNGKFALVLTGSLIAPRAGEYAFTPETTDPVRLLIDDQPVITPLEKGGRPGLITLTAGAHAVRLDLIHAGNNRPSLDVIVEGPGLAPQSLGGENASVRPRGLKTPPQFLLEPTGNRIRLQRGFVPYEPRKRLYATSVGTPSGLHYAYDFETGALLRTWRGPWADVGEMWVERGEPQLVKPNGPALTLNAFPTVALFEKPYTAGWPVTADALQSSQGYILEADGQPVFLSQLSDLSIRDRIAASPDGQRLNRRLEFKGSLPAWEAQVLLAEASSITPQPGGGWVIGDREYYIDWPNGSPHQPWIRTVGDRQLLVVRLGKATLGSPISYSLVW